MIEDPKKFHSQVNYLASNYTYLGNRYVELDNITVRRSLGVRSIWKCEVGKYGQTKKKLLAKWFFRGIQPQKTFNCKNGAFVF